MKYDDETYAKSILLVLVTAMSWSDFNDEIPWKYLNHKKFFFNFKIQSVKLQFQKKAVAQTYSAR